jgi:hypothetical protein
MATAHGAKNPRRRIGAREKCAAARTFAPVTCLTNPTIYEGLAKEVEAAIESVVTCLYIGGVERDRAVWQRHDRRARERSQAKSTL